jgi:hypothetical protein
MTWLCNKVVSLACWLKEVFINPNWKERSTPKNMALTMVKEGRGSRDAVGSKV